MSRMRHTVAPAAGHLAAAGILAAAGVLVAAGPAPATAVPALAARPAPAAPAVDTAAVPAGLREGRVLLVRPARVDVVTDGVVRRALPIPGRLDLARLPALVGDPAFASSPGPGVVELRATLAQRPGSQVSGAAPGLRELRLGPGARLVGTRAALGLERVTVDATDVVRPVGGDATVRYTHGSAVELTGVTVRGPAGAGPATPPAVQVDEGTALTAEHVRVTGGGEAALRLADAGEVSLADVVVETARGNGLDAGGGEALELDRVAARGNGGTGIVLRDPGGLRVPAGLRASGNRASGVDLLGLRHVRLSGLVTGRNGGPGVQVRSSQDVFLTGVRSTGDVTGVHVTGSADVHVADLVSRDSAGGLTVKDTARFDATGATVTGARDDGITLAGRSLTLADVRVTGAGEGVVVAGGSRAVTMRDSRFGGDRSGVRIAGGTEDVTLRRITADAPDGVAVRSGGEQVLVAGVTATGAVGADLRGSATIERSSVRATAAGVRVASQARVGVRDSALASDDVGISAAEGARVLVTGSTVDARRAAAGDVTFGEGNDVSRQPIRWVGIAGLTAMLLAIGLEVMRKVRDRGERVTRAPGHVLNRT
jgi:hypothetical protein